MRRLIEGIKSEQPPHAPALDASTPTPLPGEHVPEPTPLPRGSRMHIRRNPQFVGRTRELRALADALEAQGRTAIGQVSSVTGLGGIGKTQLAAEFVHRYGQFFSGGVFWLSFAEQVLALVHVVDAHRYPQPFPGHRDEVMARARHLIAVIDRARQPHRRPEP